MTANPASISPEASIQDAEILMEERNIRRLPVVSHGQLVGIVTRGDIREAKAIQQATSNPYEPVSVSEIKFIVEETMSSPVITAGPEASVIQVANLMLENKIGVIPVINEDGRLIGIVTESDIFRLVCRFYSEDE